MPSSVHFQWLTHSVGDWAETFEERMKEKEKWVVERLTSGKELSSQLPVMGQLIIFRQSIPFPRSFLTGVHSILYLCFELVSVSDDRPQKTTIVDGSASTIKTNNRVNFTHINRDSYTCLLCRRNINFVDKSEVVASAMEIHLNILRFFLHILKHHGVSTFTVRKYKSSIF